MGRLPLSCTLRGLKGGLGQGNGYRSIGAGAAAAAFIAVPAKELGDHDSVVLYSYCRIDMFLDHVLYFLLVHFRHGLKNAQSLRYRRRTVPHRNVNRADTTTVHQLKTGYRPLLVKRIRDPFGPGIYLSSQAAAYLILFGIKRLPI